MSLWIGVDISLNAILKLVLGTISWWTKIHLNWINGITWINKKCYSILRWLYLKPIRDGWGLELSYYLINKIFKLEDSVVIMHSDHGLHMKLIYDKLDLDFYRL
jgi:hypothetical protein